MKKNKRQIDLGFNLQNTYINLPKVFYSQQNPSYVPRPELVILNKSLAKKLGLNIKNLESEEGVEALAGNKIIKDSIPIAQGYAGHQFGHFTMLGDGRAILLGEHLTLDGKKYDVQLKGAGVTPYSRGGDGKATLGPMLREYIISEAMNNLGIPTTRSLAVVKTGEEIEREEILPGAILTRIASSHIRVGTFEYIARWGAYDQLKALADYTIERHYPYITDVKDKYRRFLAEVIERQAKLIAKWQLVGFIHGVMNTDNMTISGETIDYGPCAFMDAYNKDTVFSSIDIGGRYAYGNQPNIGQWNLARFAESLLALLDEIPENAVRIATEEVEKYESIFNISWIEGMRKKLGIFNKEYEDEKLIISLFNIMEKYKADFTNTFYSLTSTKDEYNDLSEIDEFKEWYKLWQERLSRQDESFEESKKLMQKNNPVIIPRNHLVEEALESTIKRNDYTVMNDLLNILETPYDYSKNLSKYMTVPYKNSCYRTFCGT